MVDSFLNARSQGARAVKIVRQDDGNIKRGEAAAGRAIESLAIEIATDAKPGD
jgi:hypothetical protein